VLFTYRRNKKSEEIKIAREQMNRISAKYQRLAEFITDSLTEGPIPRPWPYMIFIGNVFKECEYFGYLKHKGVIQDEDIIDYYKPKITDKRFQELFQEVRGNLIIMYDRQNQYPTLPSIIDEHLQLTNDIIRYLSESLLVNAFRLSVQFW
jgi:hypothetical protein